MNTATVVAATVMVVALIAAGVALAFAGWESGSIVGFLAGLAGVGGTVVALLDKLVTVQRVNVEQTQQLTTIERRTNGELDARIRAGSEAAAVAAAEAVLARVMNAPTASYPIVRPRQSDESASSTRTGE